MFLKHAPNLQLASGPCLAFLPLEGGSVHIDQMVKGGVGGGWTEKPRGPVGGSAAKTSSADISERGGGGGGGAGVCLWHWPEDCVPGPFVWSADGLNGPMQPRADILDRSASRG